MLLSNPLPLPKLPNGPDASPNRPNISPAIPKLCTSLAHTFPLGRPNPAANNCGLCRHAQAPRIKVAAAPRPRTRDPPRQAPRPRRVQTRAHYTAVPAQLPVPSLDHDRYMLVLHELAAPAARPPRARAGSPAWPRRLRTFQPRGYRGSAGAASCSTVSASPARQLQPQLQLQLQLHPAHMLASTA
ncbi:hypothetical protein AYI70_g6749 [Smittium culicis]|uniref:Uncharacterized protein n=1 Tax=Smittium culicis TaxID=133412 RepID=A0A1R1XNL9_9FUNG|nr:hypothetical protein AYI70_g6749 [Smittium culicis]